jgi:hypothetical protein
MLRRRAREMGLGSVSAVSLADARERAAEARRLRAAGIDPIEHRETQRKASDLNDARAITFAPQVTSRPIRSAGETQSTQRNGLQR